MSSASSARSSGMWRAIALYAVLTLLLAYPISVRPDRIAWADDPDGHLVMWVIAWDVHAFLHQPLSIFDANNFYPERRTLAYQENLIGNAFFAAPVLWLTGNILLATNFVSLLACVLCGLGAYVLARRVGIGELGALLCGVIFAFSPPRFLRFPQPNLASVQWIPFALASLDSYLEGGRKRDLLLAIGFFTLQVLTGGHSGVFLVVAILLMLLYRIALGEPILLTKRLRDLGIVGVLLFVPAVLFMIPYRINQVEMGLRRGLGSWDTPIESFLASPTRVNVFLQSLITDRNINAAATSWLFPGFLPLGLALAAVVAGSVALARRRMPASMRSEGQVSSAALYARPVLLFVIAAISWAALTVVRQASHAGDGLFAETYAGGRVIQSGYVTVGQSGLYNFGMTADETSKLSIDNLAIIDHGKERPDAPRTGSVPLSAGSHRVLLEHVRLEGQPPLDWTWAREGDASGYRTVPSWALSRRPTSYSGVIAARIVEAVRAVTAIGAWVGIAWWLVMWVAAHRERWTAWGAPYRANPIAFYSLLFLVCFALSLGPPYGLWQYVYWMPGFSFIRGSSRFMVLGLLGLAVLAGIGFERLGARLAPRGRLIAAGILVVLMSAEFAAQPFGTPYRLEIPEADRWLAGRPKPFVVAELPAAGGYQRFQTMYMLHSTAHWQKTVAGYGGIDPISHSILYQELDTFPDMQSVQHLLEIGVTYAVVHIDLYQAEHWPAVDARLGSFGDWLHLEYSDPTARVYSLRRPALSTRAVTNR